MINPENNELPEESSACSTSLDEPENNNPKKTSKEKKSAPNPDPRILALEQLTSPQEKLLKSIELMEASLAQNGTPNFKLFWEARKCCLELFKDPALAPTKSIYWPKYHELTKEALRLKALLEEQTAFAVEQIERAIGALEKEIAEIPSLLMRVPSPEFPQNCKSIQGHQGDYITIQKELALLNAYSTRITTMRKELMKTEMRIRQKNQFFQRLSSAGDKVFPRRKELIKNVSQLFIQDVDSFVKRSFSGSRIEGALHECREEIKMLQIIAKQLNLNTNAFNQTRTKLSESWDKIKGIEQEAKATRQQKKESHQKNAELVIAKIDAFSEAIQKGELSIAEGQKQHQEIVKFMKSLQIGREELKGLREKLDSAQKPIQDKIKEEERKRKELAQERAQRRVEKVAGLQTQMETMQSTANTQTAAELKEQLEALMKEASGPTLTDEEKDQFNDRLQDLEQMIMEKEEEELLKLPEDAEEALSRLEQVHQQRLQRLSETEQKLEKLRKLLGGSGLDFKQSFYYNEKFNLETKRRKRINRQIDEIETLIADLEK